MLQPLGCRVAEEVEALDAGSVAEVEAGLNAGAHPRDVKMMLAWEIASSFYGEAAADAAQEHFRTVFQKGGMPDEIPVVKLEGSPKLVELLVISN